MLEKRQNWKIFGFDLRDLLRLWVVSWRNLLWGFESPVLPYLDETVKVFDEEKIRYYRGGVPVNDIEANCSAVLLPEEHFLSRVIFVPVVAESRLDSVIELEVSANSPFSIEDTAYGSSIIRRHGEHLEVGLIIVSRSSVMTY